MACNQYGWYSPSGWICSGAAALVNGLVGGSEDVVEKMFDRVADRVSLAFQKTEFGSQVGERVKREWNGFWDHVDLAGNVERAAGEATHAFQAGLNKMKLADNIGLAGDEIGKGLGVFRERFFHEIHGFRNEIQEVFAKAARDTTLKVIPWIASGLIMLTAAPLGALYVYNRAKYNIGRPKLAGEVRYTGYLDTALDKTSRLASAAFQSVISGAKWFTAAGIMGIGSFIPVSIVCNMDRSSCPWRRPEDYLAFAARSAVIAGAAGTCYTAASAVFGKLKQWWMAPSEPKPIFNPELESQIRDITEATYNLQKNGGYFQNVLLYGPGGTGKTMVAKMIARGSNMNYIMMSGGDLAQYIKRGEHVSELNKLFESINQSFTPTILFIDEFESLARDRSKLDKAELFELLNAFLSHTGEASKKFMLIAATNRPEDIDDAVLSRMDHKLEIGLPKKEERIKILDQYIARFFNKSERALFFSHETIERMAEETDGLTGRAIFKMLNALQGKKMASSKNCLTPEMIDKTVAHFVSQEKAIGAIRTGETSMQQGTQREEGRVQDAS